LRFQWVRIAVHFQRRSEAGSLVPWLREAESNTDRDPRRTVSITDINTP
jgi:hypothetical protein